MTEATPPARRGRRPAVVNPELLAARQRNLAQLAAQRERERAVETALAAYVAAGERIDDARATCTRQVEALKLSITLAERRAEEAVAAQWDQRAQAALSIHEDGGRTVAQVAELLEVGVTEARSLIARGRGARDRHPTSGSAGAESRTDE
jgi:hypothetical protein